jgi:hypothetical protein
LVESGFHHPQALVERKPRRPGMPGQHLLLLARGVEAKLERGMPAHLIGRIPQPTDKPAFMTKSVEGEDWLSAVMTGRVTWH